MVLIYSFHKLDFCLVVKKDVRVKALEAAEAAKRLEEKKQNEREMRKAAAKLERERLKQEKELKQKQEEQKKKRDADVAANKRQRGEEERKEKQRKRKCTEEARKQQKQPTEKSLAVNDEKDVCRKTSVSRSKIFYFYQCFLEHVFVTEYINYCRII